MKKLIFSLLATAFMSFTSNAQDIKISTPVDLGFGKVSSYAGGCISANGFCAIKSSVSFSTQVAYAGMTATDQGRVAIQMNDKYYREIAANIIDGCIIIGKDFSFPKDLLDTIGIKNEYTVKAGKYKAVVSDNVYTFIF